RIVHGRGRYGAEMRAFGLGQQLAPVELEDPAVVTGCFATRGIRDACLGRPRRRDHGGNTRCREEHDEPWCRQSHPAADPIACRTKISRSAIMRRLLATLPPAREIILKLTPDALAAHLAHHLSQPYLISGDEPLLAAEAADAVRERARGAGFSERKVHFPERAG